MLLIARNAPDFYVLVGSDVSSLHRDCSPPVLQSVDYPYPHTFRDQEWILVVHREQDSLHPFLRKELPALVMDKLHPLTELDPEIVGALSLSAGEDREVGCVFLQIVTTHPVAYGWGSNENSSDWTMARHASTASASYTVPRPRRISVHAASIPGAGR